MKFRSVEISEEVRDVLAEVENRYKLGYAFGFQHVEAVKSLVERWDASAHTEILVDDRDEVAE